MTTWVVCTRCGRIEEVVVISTMSKGWRVTDNILECPRCVARMSTDDVLEEEVVTADENALDQLEDVCEICKGPCQGH